MQQTEKQRQIGVITYIRRGNDTGTIRLENGEYCHVHRRDVQGGVLRLGERVSCGTQPPSPKGKAVNVEYLD